MKTQRYTLTRTWDLPGGWTPEEAEEEARGLFQEELDALQGMGFRVLQAPDTEATPDRVTITCTLRGPVGRGYNEHDQEAA